MKETFLVAICILLVAIIGFALFMYFSIKDTVVRNPYIDKNSFRRKWHVWMCGKYKENCITIGPHYGMIQSHCRRCGHVNHGIAPEDAEIWSVPWGEFE